MNKILHSIRASVRVMSLVAVLILLAAHTAPATAQQKAQTVSGTVLDPDGNPLIGATVVVVKGTQGAVTDAKGKFTIKAKSSDSLQISYLGYKTETLNVGSRTNFTVRMEKDSSTDIDEIVVMYPSLPSFSGDCSVLPLSYLSHCQ